MSTWKASFDSRNDLKQYGDSAIGLFALQLRFQIEDIVAVAADSLTDGSDDKKADLVFIDPEDRVAVIAQCYRSSKTSRSAPSNKASDLNTAVAWLLGRAEAITIEPLKSQAIELQKRLEAGEIRTLYLWYVHNLPKSKNVTNELKTVETSAQTAIAKLRAPEKVEIISQEIGDEALEELYTDSQNPILVNEEFLIDIPQGFEVAEGGWKAYVTAIPGTFLRKVYRAHREKLFSANVRAYLGSRKDDSNINGGIKKTAEAEPGNFWAYNNGVTVLVHSFSVEAKGEQLKVKGLSIINGAQTTGAIGNLSKPPPDSVLVPARFVVAEDDDLVQSIIRYNNSQNRVTASDFRSNDRIQKRLREEFEGMSDASYLGGRRGGSSDAIYRSSKNLPSYTVGQALAAFHGEPFVAYNRKSEIWADDKYYAQFFCDALTAQHVLFVYCLHRCVEEKKLDLVERSVVANTLTKEEANHLAFFRRRGSVMALVTAIASCLETILAKRIPNSFALKFKGNITPSKAKQYWGPIVDVGMAFVQQLIPALDAGLKPDIVSTSNDSFRSLVVATMAHNKPIYRDFSKKSEL